MTVEAICQRCDRVKFYERDFFQAEVPVGTSFQGAEFVTCGRCKSDMEEASGDTINETSCSSAPLPSDPFPSTSHGPHTLKPCARCHKSIETIHIPTIDGKGEYLCGPCIGAMLAEAHDLMEQARQAFIDRDKPKTLGEARK